MALHDVRRSPNAKKHHQQGVSFRPDAMRPHTHPPHTLKNHTKHVFELLRRGAMLNIGIYTEATIIYVLESVRMYLHTHTTTIGYFESHDPQYYEQDQPLTSGGDEQGISHD